MTDSDRIKKLEKQLEKVTNAYNELLQDKQNKLQNRKMILPLEIRNRIYRIKNAKAYFNTLHPIIQDIIKYVYNQNEQPNLFDFTRDKKNLIPRQQAMWVLSELFCKKKKKGALFSQPYLILSTSRIGMIWGGMEHATVINAIKTVNNFCDAYVNEKENMEDLLEKCKEIVENGLKENSQIIENDFNN